MPAQPRPPLGDITNTTLYKRDDKSKAVKHGRSELCIDDTPIKFSLRAESTASAKIQPVLSQAPSTPVFEDLDGRAFPAFALEKATSGPYSLLVSAPPPKPRSTDHAIGAVQSACFPPVSSISDTSLTDRDADFDDDPLFFEDSTINLTDTPRAEDHEMTSVDDGVDRTTPGVDMEVNASKKRAPSPTPLAVIAPIKKKRVRQNMPSLSTTTFQAGVNAGILHSTKPQAADFTDEDNVLDNSAYQHALIKYWRFTRNFTFEVIKDLYNQQFNQSLGMESVRKRFHKGLSDQDRKVLGFPARNGNEFQDSDEVSEKNNIKSATVMSGNAQSQVKSGVLHRQPVSVAHRQHKFLVTHGHEKQLIWRWRKWLGMGWADIRNKLEREYDWSLGIGTVKKYYDEVNSRTNREQAATEASKDSTELRSRDGNGDFLLGEKRVFKPRSNSV